MKYSILRTLAFALIAFAIMFNPWLLENLISPDGHFDFAWIFWGFFIIDALALVIGFFVFMRPEICWRYRDYVVAWCVVGVVFLGVAELTLRFHEMWYVHRTNGFTDDITHPEPGASVVLGEMVMSLRDEKIIYVLKPHINVFFKDVAVRTNAFGFRDGEFDTLKGPRTIRVVGLGDSVMFGWGVREEERYMDVLEKMLQSEYPEYNWETYTLAIPGWNAVTIAGALEIYGIPLSPDMVIYGYVVNDACLPNFLSPETEFNSGGIRLLRLLNPYVSPSGPLIQSMESTPLYVICESRRAKDIYKKFVGPESFADAMMNMIQLTEDKHIPFYVLSIQNLLEKYLQDNDLRINNIQTRLLDMGSAFGMYDDHTELYLSKKDIHPSAYGHEKMAEFLFKEMQKRGVIDDLIERSK